MSESENNQIIGLIPAAGKGLRLGLPYPKELYPVIRNNRYKPVSQFVLENLVQAGAKHIVFVINETKDQLIGYFGNGKRFDCRISYVVQEPVDNEQSTSPGLANALDSAYHLTRGKIVFFGMADTIMQPGDVFARGHRAMAPDDDVLLCTFPTGSPEKFGMVRSDGRRVLQIEDKPKKTDLTHMWGCILWKPSFTEYLHDCQRHNIADFARIMNMGLEIGMRFAEQRFDQGDYLDLGTYDEIMELDRRLRD